MAKYEIIDAFFSADCGLESEIEACYLNNFAFEAESDADAIELVEDLQSSHDAKALSVVESAEAEGSSRAGSLRESYEHAPLYVSCLWRVGEEDEYEKVEC